jgi:DNA-binding transcriptional ArsR family regulator
MKDLQPVHDPRVLRAIAHPVRSRILDELTAAGSLRAADVARLLDVPANQASFHLRQLAKYGLVEEAKGEGRDRRDRVWRAVAGRGLNIDIGALEQAPGGAAAVGVWRRNLTAWAQEVVANAYGPNREKGTFRAITDQSLRLTKAEAEQLSREVDAVLQTWAERNRGRADDGRRTYLFFSTIGPYPDHLRR